MRLRLLKGFWYWSKPACAPCLDGILEHSHVCSSHEPFRNKVFFEKLRHIKISLGVFWHRARCNNEIWNNRTTIICFRKKIWDCLCLFVWHDYRYGFVSYSAPFFLFGHYRCIPHDRFISCSSTYIQISTSRYTVKSTSRFYGRSQFHCVMKGILRKHFG